MPSIINATLTNGLAISPDNSGSLQLATNNGTTAITINTSQNVGIGTTTPGDKLTIVGSPSTYINVQSTNASTGSGLYTSNATRTYLIGAGAASGNSNLEFRDVTAGATRLFLDTSGNLQLNTAGTKIFNSSGNPILQQTGSIVQVVNNAVGIGTVSTTSTSYVDITNATATITPTSSTNKILVLWSCFGSNNLVAASNVKYLQRLLRGSTSLYVEQIAAESASGGLQISGTFAITYLDSPATTSATTYKMQHGVNNASSTGTANGGNLILMEIVA